MAKDSQDNGAPYGAIRDEDHASEEKEVTPYHSHDPVKQPGLEVVRSSGRDDKQVVYNDTYDSSKQPGLEVSPTIENDEKRFLMHADQEEKHAVTYQGKEIAQPEKVFIEPLITSDLAERESQESPKDSRTCGLRRAVFLGILAAVLLVVALAIGLGAGLGSQHSDKASAISPTSAPASSSSPPSSVTATSSAAPSSTATALIGGAINPAYYSQTGAWNGSGIAYVWQNFSQNWDDILRSNEYSHVVYFQDPSGEIHWMRETSDYSWKQGAQDLLVVATDARNSTPISAVQYTANGTNYWNVFYIDNKNVVRQRTGNNGTDGWTEGSLSKANLTVWDGDLVGLSACESAINTSVPLRLFYATNSTAFEEYLWFADADQWVWQQTWAGYSGSAGVGCFGGEDGYRYLGFVNPSGQAEIWYQSNDDVQADWQKAQNEIASVHPASSLVLTLDYAFYQQNGTDAMMVADMDWQNFYTSNNISAISPPTSLEGVSGTRMSAQQNGNYTWIFYQREGDDVTWLEHAPDGDRWQVKAPVPFA